MVVRRKRSTKQKVAPSLKGFADARKRKGLLLPDIQSHIVAEASIHNNRDREKHKIHVSELVKKNWCPRSSGYKLSHTPPTDFDNSTINHRTQTFFDTGHEAHKKWQDWMWKMGGLWGSWKCEHCKNVWDALSPSKCPECDSAAITYEEFLLEHEGLNLVGHADGALPALTAIVEVKGIGLGTVRIDSPELVRKCTVKAEDGHTLVDNEALWKSLTRPLRSHLMQTMMYLWMAKEQGLGEEYDRVIFIYEFKPNQATKEFVVKYSPTLIQPLIDQLAEVVEMVKNGKIPERPAGFDLESVPCSNCVFRTHCWSEETDAQEDQDGGVVPPGGCLAGGEEATGAAGDLPAPEAEEALPGHPRRHHGARRQAVDGSVHPADEVRGVPVDTVGSRRGRRKIRTVPRRQDPGS